MKKIKNLLIVALTAVVLVPSCKKGEDDPFLSLRSRKARVAGEWKVDAIVDERTTTLINPSINSTATETITISGSSYTKVYKDASGTDTQTGTVGENSYTFDKDGTWSGVYELTTVVVLGSGTFATTETTVNRIESSGIWNFLGKIGEAKNKESMSVSTTSKKTLRTTTSVNTFSGTSVVTSTATETFAENEEVQIWKLTELRNKELKGEIEIDNSTISTSSGSSSSSTQKVSGSINITLKQ